MAPARKKPARSRSAQPSAPRADPLRQHVVATLDWHNAHVAFDDAVANVPADLRGKQPSGLPHSLWQLVEHLRLAQRDILDFCINPDYKEGKWPEDYWPNSRTPPTPTAWDESIADFKRDLAKLKRIARDGKIDLLGKLPYAPQATYLRELLLVADHNAYHVGQIVTVRRLLGAWSG
ncbi:MAG TPA: DinB family protein [Candidatus Krumholzibacteria bacterium]|nr:DinB family protein [Candidatus Krumholzibacteria bacterium]